MQRRIADSMGEKVGCHYQSASHGFGTNNPVMEAGSYGSRYVHYKSSKKPECASYKYIYIYLVIVKVINIYIYIYIYI